MSSAGRRTFFACKALEGALQVVVVTQLSKHGCVERPHGERVVKACHGTRKIAVGLHRHQLARGGKPSKRLTQVLTHHAGDAVGRGHHGIKRPVLGKPFGGRFRAHLLNPRNVIDRIAHQGKVINDAVGRNTKLLLHAWQIKHASGTTIAAHGVHQNDLIVHQLRKVFIARGNNRLHTLRRGLAGKRSNDIVRLNPVDHQHGPAQRLHSLKNNRHLGSQIFGHGRTRCLVVGINGVAKGRALGVEDAGGILGRPFVLHTPKHVHHAGDGARGMPRAASQVG